VVAENITSWGKTKMANKNKKDNKKLWITIGIVAVVLILIYSFFIGNYNSLVGLDEDVAASWGDVEVQYQRRADLIPNLVDTVKGFAAQEKEVLLGVTEARTKWLNAQGGSVGSQVEAAQGMDSALARLLVTVEAYPDLKSNQNFLALQDELAGTENRVAVARTRYNEIVKAFNKKVRMFPSNIIAGMFGFEKADLFESDNGADKVVDVEF